MKTVAITGAAGSLGKEFVRLLHKKYHIIAIDNSEWATAELRAEFPNIHTVLDDFDHWEQKTDYLIHCAAYKHIDLIELDPASSILNNVHHTFKLFERCKNNGTKFVFISTDKAVEPTSTYGMTKALGEKLAWFYGGQVARSGNFLNSSGSAIPIWEKAIAENEPIPVTDDRMTRYVCNTKEAAKEIWQRFLRGEKLIVPKQRLVSLLELVSEVLEKHGYYADDPDGLDIISKYTPGLKTIGIRPGEKLEEKLKWDWE